MLGFGKVLVLMTPLGRIRLMDLAIVLGGKLGYY